MKKEKKTHLTLALIYLIAMLVVFFAITVIKFPKEPAIDIYTNDMSGIEPSSHWYVIEKDGYEVIDEFGEDGKYHYFNVKVEQIHGDGFIMPVRTNKKTKSLQNGEQPKLEGRVAKLDNAQIKYLTDNSKTSSKYVNDIYLQDNDKKAHSTAFLFGFLTMADALLIALVASKIGKAKKEVGE